MGSDLQGAKKTRQNKLVAEMIKYRQMAQDFAVDVAPYSHAKLASVTIKAPDDEVLTIHITGGIPDAESFVEPENGAGDGEGPVIEGEANRGDAASDG